MIINFSLENWMSFSKPATFTMIASRERQHRDRISAVKKYNTRLLPIAVIYGGNASGKTNFFKALSFIKKFVVHGTQPDSLISLEPFRLDDQSLGKPSRFKLEILIDDMIYEFGFAATKDAVIEEKLVKITSKSEKTLYHRKGDKIEFGNSLKTDMFLHFAFKGTRKNQLFLTNSISQNISTFRPVYDWFSKNLELVAPDSRFEPFEAFLNEDNPMYNLMNDMLSQLDTGITHLGGETITFDHLPLSDFIKSRLEDIKGDMTCRITGNSDIERFIITNKSGKLIAKKLVAYHQKNDGTDARFDMSLESDGSRRVIDLLPAFLEVSAPDSKKVFVVDELDRSLHTLLTRHLIEFYLASCSAQSRSQLLITTHDVLLMDQHLLRRDEMWVAERAPHGSSNLLSFSEYKDVRYDKDIRKSYLQGRLGGIPRILLNSSAICHKEAD